MRANNQWLRMACQGVEEVYPASFRKVSRQFWGAYDAEMQDWCCHSCARAGRDKWALFSQNCLFEHPKHLASQTARWTTTSGHCLTDTWSYGGLQAQCARSAPIWASGCTRDPYFEILGFPRGIMVTRSGGFEF